MPIPTANGLRAKITDPDKKLVLTPELLPSPDFSKMLELFGRLSNVTITGAEITLDADDDKNFAIRGHTSLFGLPLADFSLAVEVTDDDTFDFVFSGTLASWSFRDITQSKLLPADAFQALAGLSGTVFSLVAIEFDSLGQYLTISSADSDANFHEMRDQGLGLDRIGFVVARSFEDDTASLYLTADIDIGGEPLLAQLAVPMPGFSATNYWELKQTSTFQLTSGLEEMLGFIEKALPASVLPQGFRDQFPEQVKKIPAFFIQDFQILFDPVGARRVGLVSFDIESSHPIEIVDKFTIERVGLRAMVMPATSGTVFTLELYGTIDIGDGVAINLTAEIPSGAESDWVFTIEGVVDLNKLTGISNLPGNTPAADLHLPQASNDVEIQVRHFELDFNPRKRTVSTLLFDIRVQAAFEVTHNLHIANPRLTLNVANPFDQKALGPRKIEGSLSGIIQVGTVPFQVTAEKKETSWTFSGKVAQDFLSGSELKGSLGKEFGVGADLPEFLEHIHLTDLGLSFETSSAEGGSSRTITFYCEGIFFLNDPPKEGDKGIDVRLNIVITQSGKSFRADIDAKVIVGELVFDLHFLKVNDAIANKTLFAASFSGAPKAYDLRDLISGISTEIGGFVPAGISLEIKSVVLGYVKETAGPSKPAIFLFAIDLGAELKLADLPVVGTVFQSGYTVALKDLQVIVASQAITLQESQDFNRLLPAQVTPLPTSPIAAGDGAGAAIDTPVTPPDATVMAQYVNFRADLQLGSARKAIGARVGGDSGVTRSTLAVGGPPPGADTGNAAWVDVQKSFGPVNLKRIGAAYNGGIVLLLDAALVLSGLTLELEGLSLRFPLKDPFSNLTPSLYGMSLTYQSGPLEISGGFLNVIPPPQGLRYEYNGELRIQAEGFGLAAIGSYAELTSGQSSLFVFGVLNATLGGPAFFVVTGIAAGFGYNRSLTIPTLDQLPGFPLVAAAMPTPENPSPFTGEKATDPAQAMTVMNNWVYPSLGQNWLAAGIKFTSFKILESFALLTVSFGARFEIALLGLSSLTMPPAAPEPIGFAQLALEITFAPDDGVLKVAAQLTPGSYILSQKCHLTGGFALYTWFKAIAKEEIHAGDFVVSLGGYNPYFKQPAGYPSVPRVGANWQVSDNLTIKGGFYFALTPAAVMAGGALEANFESGSFKAWFTAKADFLLYWEPFHYLANLSLSLGASYTLGSGTTAWTITIHVGVDVTLHGPPFGGTAVIDLYLFRIAIDFGPKDSAPALLSWTEFKQHYLLPRSNERTLRALGTETQSDTLCFSRVSSGLIKEGPAGSKVDWIVNPEKLEIVTASKIPCSEAHLVQTVRDGPGDSRPVGAKQISTNFGVTACGIENGALTSQHTITWHTEDGGPVTWAQPATPGGKEDVLPAVTSRLPRAAWHKDRDADPRKTPSMARINGDRVTDELTTGFKLKPTVKQRDETLPIEVATLEVDPYAIPRASISSWATPTLPHTEDKKEPPAQRMSVLADVDTAAVRAKRDRIVSALMRQGIKATPQRDTRYLANAAGHSELLAAPVLCPLGEPNR